MSTDPHEAHARSEDATPVAAHDHPFSTPIIETELLRTFVAVVDSRSFTKAAARLGLSQPAVSGHIKRLQDHLVVDLFDKSVPGIHLTGLGHTVLKYAHDILATQKAMFRHIAGHEPGGNIIRIGVPLEIRCWTLVPALARFRATYSDYTFALCHQATSELHDRFERGEVDFFIGATTDSAAGARWSYRAPLAWVAARDSAAEPSDPLDIVLHPDGCIWTALMKSTLDGAGIGYRPVFTAPHIESVVAAVRAQMGVSTLPLAGTANAGDLRVIDRLPRLPDICWNIFVRTGAREAILERLTEIICPVIAAQARDGLM
ncbi:MAG: LysR family transcriptional regulator [Xanthobacteraceae bacterium]|nr:MAG: LysR family transcriptional regulator [Xanthobacteraceae bacterium]